MPHFVFHLAHTDGASAGQAIALTAANAIVALLGLAVALLGAAQWRRADRRSVTPASRI